jgi:hypothetical protein
LTPPEHLTDANSSLLSSIPYAVAPKADGQRIIILCERKTRQLYKFLPTKDSSPAICLVGSTRPAIGGFALVVEEVVLPCGQQLYLAFDLLAADPRVIAGHQLYGGVAYRNHPKNSGLQFRPVKLESLVDRRNLLTEIVADCGIRNLVVKPIWPASETENVWEMAQRLLYGVDGLIFTPLCRSTQTSRSPTLKWKPPDKLTIDVGLGRAVERSTTGARFLPYLLDSNATVGIPIAAGEDVRHSQHVSFHIKVEGEDHTICLCDLLTCACKPLHLWVDGKESDWAQHQIAEVLYDKKRAELRFLRLRRNRTWANTVEEASIILRAQQSPPLKFSNLSFCESDLSRALNRDDAGYRSYEARESTFKTLRLAHLKIKGLLYVWFGGKSIVDAACGGLHDFDKWVEAGVQNVLALENDSALLAQAERRIESETQLGQCPSVDLRRVDLSQPYCNPEKAAKSTTACSVFCHFALHYFWESEQATSTFLSNLIPMLKPGGTFVVTYMNGDILKQRRSVKILGDRGIRELEVEIVDEHTANVFVASIGRTHSESIICASDISKRFDAAGLAHVATYSFDQLRLVLPNIEANMTSKENEMSDLYVASIFRKPLPDNEDGPLASLPESATMEILSYLDIIGLGTLRSVSAGFRLVVDGMTESGLVDQGEGTLDTYFDGSFDFVHGFFSKGTWATLEMQPAGVGTFLRLGGQFHLKELH